MIKPAYCIPSMKEINKIPPNGFNVVSTFSGIGGSCLGYRMAGYKVLWANEFIESQQKVYEDNNLNSYLDKRDIYSVTASDILKQIGKKKGEIDILDGSPPCQAFSIISPKLGQDWSKKKNYGHGKEQHNQDLFFEYIRLVKDLQPKIFIAENVKGLIIGKSKGYFKIIFDQLRKCGYQVAARLLNTKYLKVPQSRQRVIIIGVRNDLKVNPIFPEPLPYTYTVREALERPYTFQNTPEQLRLSKGSKLYQAYRKLAIGQYSKKFYNMVRIDYNKVAPCVLPICNREHYAFPLEYRRFDTNELKRLCSFPDDFKFNIPLGKVAHGLGNCVPPKMMYYISGVLSPILEKHYDTEKSKKA